MASPNPVPPYSPAGRGIHLRKGLEKTVHPVLGNADSRVAHGEPNPGVGVALILQGNVNYHLPFLSKFDGIASKIQKNLP